MTSSHELSSLPPSSLIVPSRNRPRLLLETIESVLAGDELPSEIVVVDQSDQPHPSLRNLRTDRDCRLRYFWSSSRGVCRARNEGIAVADHDCLVLIDDDIRVTAAWYGELVRTLAESGSDAVVTGRVLPGLAEQPGGFVPALVTAEEGHVYEGKINTDVLVTCHMAMRRSIWEQVGGFDERLGPGTRFPAADDNDYGFQTLEAGYRILYAPGPVVYHRAWRSRSDYLNLRWAYGRGKGGYYAKHASLGDPYMLRRMAGDVAIRVVRFPWRLLHRPDLAVGDLVYALGVLYGTAEWLLTGQAKRPANRSRREMLSALQLGEPVDTRPEGMPLAEANRLGEG